MAFFNAVANVTKKNVISSTTLLEQVSLAPFGYTDNIEGKITVVTETGDPTSPTAALFIETSSGVALTDGIGVVYANAVILAVTNNNELNFTMVVDSPELQAALAAAASADPSRDYIDAFLEARIVLNSQDYLILREPVLIFDAASSIGLDHIPAAVRFVLFNSTIVALRNDTNSLEALSTLLPTPIPTLSLLIISISGVASMWQLVTGAADVGDPDGQVQPLDYNSVTNNRHWLKVGGL